MGCNAALEKRGALHFSYTYSSLSTLCRNTALKGGEPCLTAGERSEPAAMTATLTGLRRCPTAATPPSERANHA